MTQRLATTPLSVLDLSPIVQGGRRATRSATRWTWRNMPKAGITRVTAAEHHNISGIASAATAVVIGHIAGGTTRIRVGSGGIMLPNHAPLIIAEQFGTSSRSTRAGSTSAWAAPRRRPSNRPGLAPEIRSSGDTFPKT